MSKKRSNKKQKKAKAKSRNRSVKRAHESETAISSRLSTETRGADAVTVMWLLSSFTTAIAELAWGVLFASRASFDNAEQWLAIHGIVVSIALLTGALTLVMTPIAIRVRSVRPPQPIIAGTILIGAIPFALFLISGLRS